MPKKVFADVVKSAEIGVFCCERITAVTLQNRQLTDTVGRYQSLVLDLRKRLNREKQKKIRNRNGFLLAGATIGFLFLRR